MYQNNPNSVKGIRNAITRETDRNGNIFLPYINNNTKRKIIPVYFEPINIPIKNPNSKKYLRELWGFFRRTRLRIKNTVTQESILTLFAQRRITVSVIKHAA